MKINEAFRKFAHVVSNLAGSPQSFILAVLLIAAWELVHNPEIPYRVTINEAIELGKRFGATDGHKWVNGVLDKLAAATRPDEFAQKRRKKHGE